MCLCFFSTGVSFCCCCAVPDLVVELVLPTDLHACCPLLSLRVVETVMTIDRPCMSRSSSSRRHSKRTHFADAWLLLHAMATLVLRHALRIHSTHNMPHWRHVPCGTHCKLALQHATFAPEPYDDITHVNLFALVIHSIHTHAHTPRTHRS